MAKITFMGAGSTVFVRNVLGDCMCREALRDSHFALYDIDGERLKESAFILNTLNNNINQGRATITTHLGERSRKAALRGADFVVNAIQVGGYEPSTVIDFEIPKKYGLRQTIADTLGIGGIFRALRTIPVMLDFAHDIEEVAPNAWFLNYTNPMAMLTGAMLHATGVKTVGLCHSVQVCVESLLTTLGMEWNEERARNISRGATLTISFKILKKSSLDRTAPPVIADICAPKSLAKTPSCEALASLVKIPSINSPAAARVKVSAHTLRGSHIDASAMNLFVSE